MVSIILYTHIHQPYRIRHYRYFETNKHQYWDEVKNRAIIKKVIEKSYLPTTNLFLELMDKYDFTVSFSISGVGLEQIAKENSKVIDNLRKIVDKGGEVIDETYYHSLAFLYSEKEFKEQVKMHRELVKDIFGISPKIFRNTELVYSEDIASIVKRMGYKAILAEGHEKMLRSKQPTHIYEAGNTGLKMLLRHYRLSDDISFRFSLHGWEHHPLTADKFASWINAYNGSGELINLFMDFETFGEHQWKETGIFEFLKHLPEEILKNKDNEFITPSKAIKKYPVRGRIYYEGVISWADTERDLSAWLGNDMQKYAIKQVYALEKEIKNLTDEHILNEWRRFQISDHFYFMCTKWFADGDVHKYFNPYNSPYEAFIYFMNAWEDFKARVLSLLSMKKPTRAMALKFLSDVPAGKEFYTPKGSIKNLPELLKAMEREDLNIEDVAKWVEHVVGDLWLANKLKQTKNPEKIIKERIRMLKRLI